MMWHLLTKLGIPHIDVIYTSKKNYMPYCAQLELVPLWIKLDLHQAGIGHIDRSNQALAV